MAILYDTNILLHIVRDNSIDEKVRNFVNPNKQLLEFTTIVNKGEAISIALQNGWGKSKVQKLTDLLNEIAIIDISDDKIVEAYAIIDAFSQNKYSFLKLGDSARNMGKNDLWIAAISKVFKFKLITTDGDFDHLDNIMIDLVKYLPEELKL
ncbi:PIN domain-containing protein [Arcicella sp. LKC2W]|uniref:PIN domain-containing protein n=1 Tax=Arcicella sp. LKC2W TaxID=2984198 RepID=UPI002B1EC91F|nr:PIN domain-containing protein [Arcicella sp. LKC2W]MEA5458796.1 PIN domain-containing protein [Arcicella sp. LKC2W]